MKIKRESQKDKYDDLSTVDKTVLGLSAGSIGGAILANNRFNKNYEKVKELGPHINNKEGNALLSKLKKGASDSIHFINTKDTMLNDNAAFVPETNKTKERLKKLKKVLYKDGKIPVKYIEEILEADNKDKNIILIGKNSDNAAVMSHELGHAANFGALKNEKGSVIGRFAHKIPRVGSAPVAIGNLGSGFALGYNSVDKDEEGNIKLSDKAKRNALISAGIGLGTVTPTLLREASASRTGIKMLKKAGASRKYLKQSQNLTKHTFNTYLYNSGVGNLVNQGIGNAVGMKVKADKLKKEARDNKKEG